jgi:ribosomal protein L11 methyltransferase
VRTAMKWLQVSVSVDAELAEAVADVLSRFAAGGVAIELLQAADVAPSSAVAVKAYLAMDSNMDQVRGQIEEALWHLSQISPFPGPEFSVLEEQDWAAAWKEHFYPLRIGRSIVIKPTWRQFQPEPSDVIIELDPGMAFGTGLHPTTRMCLLALEERIQQGMSVLDLGTGSGILAIAAAKLGAGSVLALDTDKVAVQVAGENAQRNGVWERVVVSQGSLDQARDTYDLVVVNILADVIVALAQQGLAQRVHRRGTWIAAGIIENQAADVEHALSVGGLRVTDRSQIKDWVALIGRRSDRD